jgi:hypothetical protein
MPRYYFHTRDSRTMLDDEGVELPGLKAAREAALVNSGEILKNGAGPGMWSGTPWRMWVTDAPNGGGKTFFTLTFSATEGEEPAS